MSQALLVRMPNWLGDCVMAAPALAFLKKQGFDCTLVGNAWLKHLPFDAPIIHLQDSSITALLKAHPSRHYLLLTHSFSSAWQARIAGKKPIGYARDGRRWLLSRACKLSPHLHESLAYLQLAQWFSQQPVTQHLQQLESFRPTSQKTQTEAPCHLPQRFVLICPFAIGLSRKKQCKIWPHWPELIAHLCTTHTVLACPAPNEKQQAQDLAKHGLTVLNYIDLSGYQTIMARASLVIGNDTGPMHLASLHNTRCLTLFGVTSPKKSSPLGSDYLGDLGQWPSLEAVCAWHEAHH